MTMTEKPDWWRPALDDCECPPNPVNESEQCDPCNDDFVWRYGEPDGYATNEQRVAAGDDPVHPEPAADRGHAELQERAERWRSTAELVADADSVERDDLEPAYADETDGLWPESSDDDIAADDDAR